MGNMCGLGGLFWRLPLPLLPPPPPPSREVPYCEQPSFGDLTCYDVFLNHRGPDVKKTFVSQLEDALFRAGHEAFLDAKSLIKGHSAMRSINEALTGVKVHVAVFSPRYAESKFCLNELCDMLGSGKPIIPVFYNVEPVNLRCTDNGPFAKAFHEHLKKGRSELVVKWRAALVEAAGITGYRRAESENDTILVKKVVEDTCNVFPRPPRPVALHPVGLKKSSMPVIRMLHDMGNNVGVMGICGMGGIGKTTLAKEVYNREQSSFRSTCFLDDVKEAKGSAVIDLQVKMVMDLLHVDAKKENWNFSYWFKKIRQQRVFIVIDDINDRKQFDALILDVKELAAGSRILIISREQDILRIIMKDAAQSKLYLVPKLSPADSTILFVKSAFRRSSISDVDICFHDFVTQIVRACDGLPLALEVTGGLLVDKKDMPEHKKYWEDAVFELRKSPNILSKLQLSYNGLENDGDKRMFLDIACFMLGHPKQVAMEIWESSGYYGHSPLWSLDRLINKNLIKVDVKEKLAMHDLLRDMGRHIVIERAEQKLEIQSHIWDPSTGEQILQKKKGLNKVLALTVAGTTSLATCKAENYAQMEELRCLILDHCSINGSFMGWSQELKWLQWQYIPHQTLPSSLKLPNLVVLDLSNSDCLTHVWIDNVEMDLPCRRLQMLILKNCANLKKLPKNMNVLVKMKFLNLKNCNSLKSLPNSLGDLVNLVYLNLLDCALLQEIPHSICALKGLKTLRMARTSVEELPESIGDLQSLTMMDLSNCGSLRKLPESISNLSNLEDLDLSYCTQLQEIPHSICALKGLKTLQMARTSVEELPESIGDLQSLTMMDLSNCGSLRKLPESISNLSNLEDLDLSYCTQLQEIPHSICALKGLKTLQMARTSVEELPESIGDLQSLTMMDLSNCGSLRKLPESISNLSNLEDLDLSYCTQLQEIPHSICALKGLKTLRMARTSVEELPESIGDLQSLTMMDLSNCGSLRKLPESISNLSNLWYLYLSHCTQLQEIPHSICALKGLKTLRMARTSVEELPESIGDLQSLTMMDLSNCGSLRKLPESISNLSNLEDLGLSYCTQLQEIPHSICALKGLKTLRMARTSVEELPESIGNLQSLTMMDLSNCGSLRKLPESISNLPNLRYLYLLRCTQLQEIPHSMFALMRLKTTQVGATSVEDLLENSGDLQRINL